jgi:glycerol-1-phosphate dehydrogenase [NAD(P)+]
MDLNRLLDSLKNCPCGREHSFDTKLVEVGSGLVHKAGEILIKGGFPKKILLIADRNTLKASSGLLESLDSSGFEVKQMIYPNLTYARSDQVDELGALVWDVDGVLSVGTGSIGDVGRVTAYQHKKAFAIFATAPSMDGFASDTAPIIKNNFKTSWQAAQPSIIIADTKILADSPTELKAAGFGDMIAKYVSLVDWKISKLLTNEYYCDAIAELTEAGIRGIVEQADNIVGHDEAAAGKVLEALVMTGLAMKLACSSRPASGAEHVLSHYWECQKLAQGLWPEFHGKKVGVGTVIINRLYRKIAESCTEVAPIPDPTDWEEVKAVYGPLLVDEMMKMNNPTITDKIDIKILKDKWPEIRRIILTELPEDEELVSLMKRAGAVTEPFEVHVDDKLLTEGLRYHSYMRYRVLLSRLLPMLQIDPVEVLK